MAQTILYYPQIDIKDGTWLRNAVLYWDEVSSIVPNEYYNDFSPELKYLQQCGVYKPVYPQDLFNSVYANEFCDVIVKKITKYERSVLNSNTNGRNIRIHKDKIYDPTLHEFIHHNKLPPNLLQFFSDKRLVNDYDTDGWMEMDSKIVHIYMRTLAEYSIKCSDKDIVLGTDTISRSKLIYNKIPHSYDTQTQCCTINIQKCLPQPSLNVGFEDILDFKSRRKDELTEFKTKIREFEANIYQAVSPEEIKFREAQFIESWEHCCDDYKRVLKEAGIKFTLTTLISLVAIPFVQQTISQYIGQNTINIIQTVAPFLQIGIEHYNYKDKLCPHKSEGGFSYIMKASKEGIINA